MSRLPPVKVENYKDPPPSSPCQSKSLKLETAPGNPLNPSTLTIGPNSRLWKNAFGTPCRPGYGDIPKWTKFGLNARRTISRCGGALDQMVGHPSEIVFLTGTIPNGYDDGRLMASAYSSWIVRSLKHWTQKFIEDNHDFYVWEYQKRGVLHLHMAIWVKDAVAREGVLAGFQMAWYRILDKLSKATGVDMLYSSDRVNLREDPSKLQAYAQEVYASATQYLAKYTSKQMGDYGWTEGKGLYPPVRWWGCSRPLLCSLRERTSHSELIIPTLRRAEGIHGDISSMLDNLSDVCHTYKDKVNVAKVTVAYNTATIGIQLCHNILRTMSIPPTSRPSLITSSDVISSLKAIIRTARITEQDFLTLYSPYAQTCHQELYTSDTPTIIAVMEMLNATAFILWSRWHNRPARPAWYGRAVARIESNLNWILYRRGGKTWHPYTPLKELD
jgi:hypothetical protein